MIQRLYTHNFKCLENFELTLKGMPSASFPMKTRSYLIGKATCSRLGSNCSAMCLSPAIL